jgi:NitT/TauT family transport system permease protein
MAATRDRVSRGFVSFLWALAGIVLIAIMWELTKLLGTVIELPFNSSDQAMPHIWTMFSAFSMPEVRGSETTVFQAVLSAATYSLLLALGGFVVGVSVGLLLAIIMQRFFFL